MQNAVPAGGGCRRTSTVFAAVACAVLVWAPCGAEAWSNEPKTITLISPHSNGGIVNRRLAEAGRDFERLKGDGTKVHVVYESWGNLFGGLKGNKTTGADIAVVGSTWTSDLYDNGVMSPITDRLEEWRRRRGVYGDVTRDFVRNLEFTYMFPKTKNGKTAAEALPVWHALPMDVGTSVFFYRKDLFLKYFGHDRAPVTLAEAMVMSQVIVTGERLAGNPNMAGLALPAGGGTSVVMQILTTFVMGRGSAFVGSGEECTFESREFVDAVTEYTSFYHTGQHAFRTNGTGDIAASFADGNVAMFFGALWLTFSMRFGQPGSLLRSQVGVGSIPAGIVGPYTFQGGSGWAIPSWVSTEKADLAWEFLTFFMEPTGEYLKGITFGGGLMPAYESVQRTAKLTVADRLNLTELTFYGPSGAKIDASGARFAVDDTGFGTGKPEALVGAGEWSSSWPTTGTINVTVTFPAAVAAVSYTVTSSAGAYERDPAKWVVEVPDSQGGWMLVHNQADGNFVSMLRGEESPRANFTDASGFPSTIVSATFRLRFSEGRGSLCDETCVRTIDQLPFAVPLHYPQLGFFKMGRIEANLTIERLVQRVTAGMPVEEAAARGCAELEIVLRDPALPELDTGGDDTLVVVLVAVVCALLLIMVVVAALVHRFFYAKKTAAQIHKLKTNVEIAEELAKAVAIMDLESVQYLYTLENPSRIQASFILILSMLTEYRAYLPAAVLVDDETADAPASDGKELDDNELQAVSVSSVSNEKVVRAREKAMELGIRVRKATLMLVAMRMPPGELLASETFTLSTDWLGVVLGTLLQQEAIVLSLRPDSVLASWNAHKVTPKHVMWACQASLMLQSKLEGYTYVDHRESWCISMSTGKLSVGQYGNGSMKLPYVMGLPLNQCEALRQLCSRICTQVLATDAIIEESSRFLNARPVDVMCCDPASNRAPFFTVWEVVGDGLPKEGDDTHGNTFKEAWVAFRNQDHDTASSLWMAEVNAMRDYQALRLLRICMHAMAQPEQPYFRRYVGWQHLEDESTDAALPANTVTEGVAPPFVPAGSESDIALVAMPRSSQNSSHPDFSAVSKDSELCLRDEVEKERIRATVAWNCGKCGVPMVDVPAKGPESWGKWKCSQCGLQKSGPRWECAKCQFMKCRACAPEAKRPCVQQLRAKQIPDGFGGYYERSDKVLGRGAQGTVYMGMEPAGGLVAIKTVPIAKSKENTLIREVELLKTLRHEYIVSYHTSCCIDGNVVIVMEYVSGGSLSVLLEQFGSLNLECLKRFLKDILTGLSFLHSQDIVHRDLKPCNVLLMADGQCKLSDFGTSATVQHITMGEKDSRLIGTPIYMSPEACIGKSPKAVDIWALGITVFQLATGNVPYSQTQCSSVYTFLDMVAKGTISPETSPVGGHLGDFIRYCLAPDPAKRPTTDKLLLHSYLL